MAECEIILWNQGPVIEPGAKDGLEVGKSWTVWNKKELQGLIHWVKKKKS